MDIDLFFNLGYKNLLGKIFCHNGEKMIFSQFRPAEPWSLKLMEIFPIIFFPEDKKIIISDIVIFGSMVYPKKKIIEKGWIFKRQVEKKEIPQDIDIAIITEKYESKYIEEASLVMTYDMGTWLQRPGIDLAHIPKNRLKEENYITSAIKKGISLFSNKCEWKWERGLKNCYL